MHLQTSHPHLDCPSIHLGISSVPWAPGSDKAMGMGKTCQKEKRFGKTYGLGGPMQKALQVLVGVPSNI